MALARVTSRPAPGSALRIPEQFVASQYRPTEVAGGRSNDELVLLNVLRGTGDGQFAEAALPALWRPDDQPRLRAAADISPGAR